MLPEIWAYGLRNPWRFSFDRTTGDLYIGDVGQNKYEEIDFQPSSSQGGENYGWDCREGLHDFELVGCPSTGFVDPILEYGRNLGCSVTGGVVYRGSAFPRMQGIYFYGDYCTGRIWGVMRGAGNEWQNQQLIDSNALISSFGADEAGNIYVVGLGGTIYAIKDVTVFEPTDFVYLPLLTVKRGGTTTLPPGDNPNPDNRPDSDEPDNDTPDNDAPAADTPVVEPAGPTPTDVPTFTPTPSSIPSFTPTAEATLTPVPTQSALDRVWDPRLDQRFATYTPAQVVSGQGYWKLIKAVWFNESESQGRHHIFVDVLDRDGKRMTEVPILIDWPDGSHKIITEAKPGEPYASNFDMYSRAPAYAAFPNDGAPADMIGGMGLGEIDSPHLGHHTSYGLTWQWTIAEDPQTPALTPTETSVPTETVIATPTPLPTETQ